MPQTSRRNCRNLVIVLGDQIDIDSAAFDQCDSTQDFVGMAEIATFYWEHLVRHQDQLKGNNCMSMQLKNLDHKMPDDLKTIQKQAKRFRESLHPSTGEPRLAKKRKGTTNVQ